MTAGGAGAVKVDVTGGAVSVIVLTIVLATGADQADQLASAVLVTVTEDAGRVTVDTAVVATVIVLATGVFHSDHED